MMAMNHATALRPTACATCEVEIVGPPVVEVGLSFCCSGCVAGGPCICSYDRGPETGGGHASSAGDQVRYCLDVREMVMLATPAMPTAR